jgi:hypothetical protein
VVAVRHLVAQLAVALARDPALVRHQTAGDQSFADALSHVSCRVQLATRRRAADRGEHRQAAGGAAPEIGRLSVAAAKKVEPRSSAQFGFLSLTLAFYVLGSMRELTKAKPAFSM